MLFSFFGCKSRFHQNLKRPPLTTKPTEPLRPHCHMFPFATRSPKKVSPQIYKYNTVSLLQVGSSYYVGNFFRSYLLWLKDILNSSLRRRNIQILGHDGPHVVGEQPGVGLLDLAWVVNRQVFNLEQTKDQVNIIKIVYTHWDRILLCMQLHALLFIKWRFNISWQKEDRFVNKNIIFLF